jgi:hypothetical protein
VIKYNPSISGWLHETVYVAHYSSSRCVGWLVGFAFLVGSGCPLELRPVASGPASGPGKGRRRRACAFHSAATKAQREAWQKEETTSLLLLLLLLLLRASSLLTTIFTRRASSSVHGGFICSEIRSFCLCQVLTFWCCLWVCIFKSKPLQQEDCVWYYGVISLLELAIVLSIWWSLSLLQLAIVFSVLSCFWLPYDFEKQFLDKKYWNLFLDKKYWDIFLDKRVLISYPWQ